DDQRGARLVDENRVDLVDDGVMQAALHLLAHLESHVVAQVIEAVFVVGAVGDVGGVGGTLFVRRLTGLDHADGKAQGLVDGTHPVGVTLGEVIVHGDHVHALGGQRVQVSGKRGDQR